MHTVTYIYFSIPIKMFKKALGRFLSEQLLEVGYITEN